MTTTLQELCNQWFNVKNADQWYGQNDNVDIVNSVSAVTATNGHATFMSCPTALNVRTSVLPM